MALAIVVDDSLSMRAAHEGKTRFDRARSAARELLSSVQDGDAVAIVLAGAPPRVALAATTELSAAKDAIEALEPSDRGTDLDGALTLARSLVEKLPQVDRRVVLLSDLADGKYDAQPVGEGLDMPLWIPLEDIRVQARDCAVLSADREGARIVVRFACSHGATGADRSLLVQSKKGEIAHAALPSSAGGDVSVIIPADAPDDLEVRLSGSDAIASDDVAPVLVTAGPGAIAVIADAEGETAATGGAPVLEQALAALKLDLAVRPIPAVPDRAEDLAGCVALVVDDPPGFTPEQRHVLAAFTNAGGSVLVALGPRASAAPLGATLDPILGHATSWEDARGAKGADPNKASGLLAEASQSLVDLAARKRTSLAQADVQSLDTLVPWTDGAPLVADHALGSGHAWIITLPFSLDASDLPLRPGFLALLDAWIDQARQHVAARRAEVGATWIFPPGERITVTGPKGALPIARDQGALRASPPLIGTYLVEQGGRKETRVAQVPLREIDLRPRAAAKNATSSAVGGTQAPVDASPAIAAALLALVAAEMALRLWSSRATAEHAEAPVESSA